MVTVYEWGYCWGPRGRVVCRMLCILAKMRLLVGHCEGKDMVSLVDNH